MNVSVKWIAAGVAAFVALMVTLVINFPPSGCTPETKVVNNPGPALESVETTTKTVAQDLPVRANRIDNSADNITKIVATDAPKVAGKVGENTTAIKVQTEGVRNDAVKLTETTPSIEKAKDDTASLIKANNDLKAKNDKLVADKNSSLRKLTGFLIIGSIIGIGVGVALFFSNTPIGMAWGGTVILGSGAALVASIVVGYYSLWLMVGVAALALGGLGYAMWRFYVQHKTNKELVQTVEAAKQLMPEDERLGMFGHGAVPGAAHLIQSDTTQKVVQNIRNQIPETNLAQVPPVQPLVPDPNS